MTRTLQVAISWFDRVERTSDWQIGPPGRRWSWFQVAWAGLHASALLMHGLSVVYHARRVQPGQLELGSRATSRPARDTSPVALGVGGTPERLTRSA